MSRRDERFLPPSSVPLVDGRGMCSPSWYKYFLDLNRTLGGDGKNQIGGLIDGTTAVKDIGSLQDAFAVVNANAEQAAMSGGSLYGSANPPFIYMTGSGNFSTTITASGGSGSYTYLTTYLSGFVGFTLTLDNTNTPTISYAHGISEPTRKAIYKTVIDDGSNTVEVQFGVTSEGGF